MDALTPAAVAVADAAAFRPPVPPESPLSMPTQPLARWDPAAERARVAPELWRTPWISRTIVMAGAIAVTWIGSRQMYRVVEVGGVTELEWILLVLFVVNFAWVALGFLSAVVGFAALLFRLVPRPPAAPLQHAALRTAIVMPVYNEAPSRIFAAMQAIYEDVAMLGPGPGFDFFFLSDTTDPDVWIAEERSFLALRERLGPDAPVYYRHRPKNERRKAGNIEDFVKRWGGAYDAMIILDADSIMSGEAIVTLAAAMEADPDAGIIQTLPCIINRSTFFARLQQFASRVYGPIVAAGIAVWHGRDGNYWGHNAIIRVKAFAGYAGLPDLPGRPPFGGLIMSHDFVEAALIRRGGWAVYMLPTIDGSYEESPPSLIDLAARDRRWCQGNLQHIALLATRGLKPLSREHLLHGIMSYLASPFWLFMLLCGIALALQASFIRPEYFTDEFSLFPSWPRFDAERALTLFLATMGILLAPKLFGLVVLLLDGPLRRASGGGLRATVSALIEIVFSALFAPMMMLIQSGSVFQILLGRDTGWRPQRRDDGTIPLRDIVRRHRVHMALGLLTLFAGLAIAPSLVAWMSPTIVGLILAIPLSWTSGQLALGVRLREWGLLLVPEETRPPAVVTRANTLAAELRAAGMDEVDALTLVHNDPHFRDTHEKFLPPAPRRRRGDILPERALAEAKLTDAESLEDARSWLSPREAMVVLHDRALLGLLSRLPEKPVEVQAA